MNALSPDTKKKYDLNFARWVYENVDGGDRLSMCMQCGVCSGSCPIGDQMDYGPRKLFMMVRAGMKEAVLKANTMFNCVSCYNCVVRCPRSVPVKYILHGLGRLALQEGYAKPKEVDNSRFADAFWWSVSKYGKTDERLVTAKYYFSAGLSEGIKRGMGNMKIAMGMIKTKRMHLGMPHKTKKQGELKAILAKAVEIQNRNHGEG
ncbi:4Fe-4S dicluster domain-containing protein [Varunaivibrio sulfuroxidans]|uniref:Quinone-modifying oxidoreductase subunit QmoC n=1 Tax=Varunaivibrio sulfuroxidans TaxID=1773489 RepID=A0A4R3J773_9PROT|nr:4Fe-4S dicluster domain-containing protein [Varunaivibrio sulfuroxidans]TCS60310.1 quinone-modifying oxidoreductase subunit QmoC [Varunaivibrio sulfuroxidans]WES31003.1 4Fe-4S dicluster domain-containing protein [Varunaivibrio sulfuroxidans]